MDSPPHPPLKTRTAVITGASSGIGRAVARQLAEAGAFLHLLGRDRGRLESVAEEARAAGGEADVHTGDLSDDGAIEETVAQLGREVRAVDILIHSAGAVSLGVVSEMPVADLDHQYRVNLRAPYALTQGLLPLVRAAKGQIVFVNSGAGLNAKAGWSAYAATKHGLKALADSLREEVREDGVRVVSLYPGRTASPMQRSVREMEGQPYHPEGFIQPEDIAQSLLSALTLPRSADVTDLMIRPGVRPGG